MVSLRFWGWLFVGVAALFLAFPNLVAAVQNIYVSPIGSDSNSGTQTAPLLTLDGAKLKVRTMNRNMTEDIVVNIDSGIYQLTQPVVFNSFDSGTNGFKVIYRALPGSTPVISGGISVAKSAWVQDGIRWRANIGTGKNFRQLYVNGKRALRARSVGGLANMQVVSNGFTTTNTQIATWENITDVEVVGNVLWQQFRCGIAGVANNLLIMKSPCFPNSQLHPEFPFRTVSFLENALELLDAPGEWYYQRPSGWLYYQPRSNEVMPDAEVIIPVAEQLITGQGTSSQPISNIEFQNLTFSYTTWNRPSNNDGWSDIQAGYTVTGGPYTEFKKGWTKPEAAVDFSYITNSTFSGNIFSHIGSVGLGLGNGSQHNVVSRNEFFDISANGLMVGDVDQAKTADAAVMVTGNTISENTVHQVAQDYAGSVGIFLGYTKNSRVASNTLYDLPYTAISMGWGWGRDDPSFAENNTIEKNLVFNNVNYLMDGGAIYTLSLQPDSVIRNNVLLTQANEYGSLYLDEASQHFTVENNVVFNNHRTAIVKGGDHYFHDNWWQDRGYIDNKPDVWWLWYDGSGCGYDGTTACGINRIENNHVITSLSQVPGEIIASAGTPVVFLNPTTSLLAGAQTVRWRPLSYASRYIVKIDDLANGFSCTNILPGDMCNESVVLNTVEHAFIANHTYIISVQPFVTVTNSYGPVRTVTLKAGSGDPTAPKVGDANGDGKTDGIDYVIWLNHYGQVSSGPSVGDFDNSGKVDGVDYVLWLNNYQN